MKKRAMYALLFGIPGFFVSAVITMLVSGTLFGFLWIFVFGDNPRPSSTDSLLSIILVSIFLVIWAGSIILGYVSGKRLEKDTALNRRHVLASAGLTVLFILFIMLQQWSVGNLGSKTDSALCSDYCISQGYSASGLPPKDSGDRTCSCYDNSGNEVLKTPLDNVEMKTR